ncbi:MAG: type II toxin-antitoxin system VapC family toxin, partial [Gemmatimonas sp.]
MILVDSSLWVDHLRSRSARLAAALEWGEVAMHPFVIGELACGHLRNRQELLDHWSRLPAAPVATDSEVLVFIENHRLIGHGLGYIDMGLLASVALGADLKLWTRDTSLARAAERLGL